MDNNDVELTMSRKRRDTDEVYPADELQKFPHSDDSDLYQPTARRQNRCFLLGIVFFVLAIGAALGAKVYLLPAEDAALVEEGNEGGVVEQGTVMNNAENAKMAEAMRKNSNENPNNTPGTAITSTSKPHSSSHWSELKDKLMQEKDGEGADDGEATTAEKPTNEETTADETTAKEEEESPESEGEEDEPAIDETTTITNEEEPQPTEQPNQKQKQKDKQRDYEAWHKIKVTRDSGLMYEVQAVLDHGKNSFTEGLTFHDGKLYESVGLNRASKVLVLDPDTGSTVKSIPMAPSLFGEGLAYAKGKLYQLTYKAKRGFIYDPNDLDKKPGTFKYETTTGEGWGMTYDAKKDELVVSDGSANLHYWDRETLKPKRKHQIMRLNGHPAVHINELEWWRDRVVANVWFQNVLLIINPVSGLVEKEYDFDTIWDQAGVSRNPKAEVFNGISVSSDEDVLYVTGKWWGNMFKVKLLPEVPEV